MPDPSYIIGRPRLAFRGLVEPLVARLRRRVGQRLLEGDSLGAPVGAVAEAGSSAEAAVYEAAAASAAPPSFFRAHLLDAARHVAARVASEAPRLLPTLIQTGTAASVAGALAVVAVRRDGADLERVPFRHALLRPVTGCYVLADGRLWVPDAEAVEVEVVRPPVSVLELAEWLHDAVVEEAAATVFLALGGNTPAAWGRADNALEAVVR